MIQVRAILRMAVSRLLNVTIFSNLSTDSIDLERSLHPIPRSHHYLMMNVSETVRGIDLVSMEYTADDKSVNWLSSYVT